MDGELCERELGSHNMLNLDEKRYIAQCCITLMRAMQNSERN